MHLIRVPYLRMPDLLVITLKITFYLKSLKSLDKITLPYSYNTCSLLAYLEMHLTKVPHNSALCSVDKHSGTKSSKAWNSQIYVFFATLSCIIASIYSLALVLFNLDHNWTIPGRSRSFKNFNYFPNSGIYLLKEVAILISWLNSWLIGCPGVWLVSWPAMVQGKCCVHPPASFILLTLKEY